MANQKRRRYSSDPELNRYYAEEERRRAVESLKSRDTTVHPEEPENRASSLCRQSWLKTSRRRPALGSC